MGAGDGVEERKGSRLAEILRRVTFSLERVVTEEAASSAVRGAADGLRDELPALADDLRRALSEALAELRDSARSGLEQEDSLLTSTARTVAGSAMEGALQHLEREWKNGGLPLHDVAQHVNTLLQRMLEVLDAHRADLVNPAYRARQMSAEIVATAIDQISNLEDELRALLPILEEVGRQMGRGLADGAVSGTQAHLEALTARAEELGQRVARRATDGALDGAEPRLSTLSDAVGRGLVRGVVTELREQLASERGDDARRALKEAGAAVADGAWTVLSARLKRPLLLAGGAMTALVATLMLVPRRR